MGLKSARTWLAFFLAEIFFAAMQARYIFVSLLKKKKKGKERKIGKKKLIAFSLIWSRSSPDEDNELLSALV